MKKIQSIILLATITLIISCAKETNNITTTDNPNIIHRTINTELFAKSDLTNVSAEIDIDSNSISDFAIQISLQKFSQSVSLLGIASGNSSLATAKSIEEPFIVNNLPLKSKINAISTTYSTLSMLAIYNNEFSSNIIDAGYAGEGDILVGIQFFINGNTHYGWLLINVSESKKYIIIKEAAYDSRPNTEILAGEK